MVFLPLLFAICILGSILGRALAYQHHRRRSLSLDNQRVLGEFNRFASVQFDELQVREDLELLLKSASIANEHWYRAEFRDHLTQDEQVFFYLQEALSSERVAERIHKCAERVREQQAQILNPPKPKSLDHAPSRGLDTHKYILWIRTPEGDTNTASFPTKEELFDSCYCMGWDAPTDMKEVDGKNRRVYYVNPTNRKDRSGLAGLISRNIDKTWDDVTEYDEHEFMTWDGQTRLLTTTRPVRRISTPPKPFPASQKPEKINPATRFRFEVMDLHNNKITYLFSNLLEMDKFLSDHPRWELLPKTSESAGTVTFYGKEREDTWPLPSL